MKNKKDIFYVKVFFVKHFYDGTSESFEYVINGFSDYTSSGFMRVLRTNDDIEVRLLIIDRKTGDIIGSYTTLYSSKHITHFMMTVLDNTSNQEFADSFERMSKLYPYDFVGQYLARHGEIPPEGLDVVEIYGVVSDKNSYDKNLSAVGSHLVKTKKVFGKQNYMVFGYDSLSSVGEDFVKSNNLSFCGNFLYRENKYSLDEGHIWF